MTFDELLDLQKRLGYPDLFILMNDLDRLDKLIQNKLSEHLSIKKFKHEVKEHYDKDRA